MAYDLNQVEALRLEADRVFASKGFDYTKGNADRCTNFKMAAEAAGMRPMQAWLVYTLKHHTAVVSFVKNAGEHESEPIFQRFVDVYNYVRLGWLLCHESVLYPTDTRPPIKDLPLQGLAWDLINKYVKHRKTESTLIAIEEAAGDAGISKMLAWLCSYVVQYRRITDLVREEAELHSKGVGLTFAPNAEFLLDEFVSLLQKIEAGWVLLCEVFPQK